MSEDVEGLSSFEKLFPKEEYWRNHYEWLKGCGYELRPRFRPGWVPSWKLDPTKTAMLCPDAWSPFNPAVMDARRLSDGSNVVLKKVDQFLHPFELEISEFFTGLGKSCENHCIPLLGTLRPPNEANLVILVLPYLRAYNSPRFDTFGEAVELFRQLFEGLQFMHRHNVAHRDNHSLNLLMDGVHLYPHGFQSDILHQDLKLGDKYGSASHTTRTWEPVKYYFADFGISRQYSASQREEGILDTFIMGGDKSPPEHQGKYSKVNPFATDIYFLGNFIKTSFVERDDTVRTVGFRGFEFMTGLVADMTQEDPAKRPNIDEAVARFAEIQKSLSSWKLRSRVVSQKEGFFRLDRVIMHWSRRVRSFVFRRPAIPTPPE